MPSLKANQVQNFGHGKQNKYGQTQKVDFDYSRNRKSYDLTAKDKKSNDLTGDLAN